MMMVMMMMMMMMMTRFRITLCVMANGKHEICVYVFLKKN